MESATRGDECGLFDNYPDNIVFSPDGQVCARSKLSLNVLWGEIFPNPANLESTTFVVPNFHNNLLSIAGKARLG